MPSRTHQDRPHRCPFLLAPRAPLLLVALAPALLACPVDGQTKNGFELKNASIPHEEIRRGGPPRDGIPAIDHPKFTDADGAGWLRPDDRVLGLARHGVAKAYPLRILVWHEIVNDRFAGESVVVSYCPLCGSGMAFEAEIGGEARSFGVSGLLYNSDVLLYDRGTESLWSQIEMEAVSGPLKATKLRLLPMRNTTWQAWRSEHPDTRVLSRETGHRRDYDATPYEGYGETPDLYFPVTHRDRRFHPKAPVLGLELDGETFKAYPFDELDEALDGKSGEIADTVGGQELTVRYDAEAGSAAAFDAEGRELPTVRAFWFAWVAFHPDTEVYEAK
jgi:hypothetical protein